RPLHQVRRQPPCEHRVPAGVPRAGAAERSHARAARRRPHPPPRRAASPRAADPRSRRRGRPQRGDHRPDLRRGADAVAPRPSTLRQAQGTKGSAPARNMTTLITQVKSKLFIHSSQKSTHALDGAYASLLHARSLDFDDLREYEYGDQVRDIDWRATARIGTPLVKRYRANRMHTVLFVVDTGLSMTALAHDEKPKKDLAILATGALGVLALRHGDDFSLVDGDADRIRRRAPGRSEGALEHALRAIDHAIANASAPSDRDGLLSYV